ncbi:membrane-spanning 4-domains subfamily A member 4D-like isoform X4 [Anguilla anguilla]|uniref:membrane-spanning 4-domains subfamily A member 4D-like isoform X4 n=1 Tax=Anguilla anguilla TaxID=7936 RepID=UPI0015AED4E5|nr:membrane-spanning 4-domains subfamily A member 4D-like isoform X4 [Anguilla anguilla]
MVAFTLDIYCVVPGVILTVRSLLIKIFWAHLNEGTTCKMASSAASGFVVVTQVYPQQSGPTAPAFCTTSHVSSALGKFLKGHPKALGTVQIMIGDLIIIFGIVMSVIADSIGFYSGIVFWGALIYMSAGALTMAANDKLNKCRTASQWMTGVLLVFSILEFIISICVSAFACRAVCDCSTEQVLYMAPTSNQVASENLSTAPNTYEMTISVRLCEGVRTQEQSQKNCRSPKWKENKTLLTRGKQKGTKGNKEPRRATFNNEGKLQNAETKKIQKIQKH